jgi:hypothetical protein
MAAGWASRRGLASVWCRIARCGVVSGVASRPAAYFRDVVYESWFS